MSLAGVYNIDVQQGATKRFSIVYKDGDGVPIDLTGYEGRGQIRLKVSDENALADFVVTITDAVNGEIDITLPATALEGIKFRGRSYLDKTEASYDIEIYDDASGDVIRLLNGICTIYPEVTK